MFLVFPASPGQPYGGCMRHFNRVEANMRLRFAVSLKILDVLVHLSFALSSALVSRGEIYIKTVHTITIFLFHNTFSNLSNYFSFTHFKYLFCYTFYKSLLTEKLCSTVGDEFGYFVKEQFLSFRLFFHLLKMLIPSDRREEIQALLGKNEAVMSLCIFPR